MGTVRRGYARRFGAAADTCCALRQCRFAALTLFVAPILPARNYCSSVPLFLPCLPPLRFPFRACFESALGAFAHDSPFLRFSPNCQLFGTNLRLCTIRNALFLPSANRELGFCKNEASLGPFRSVKTVHNRKFLPFFAKSGHGLGYVDPFGHAVEGFMGGAVGMDAEKLAC